MEKKTILRLIFILVLLVPIYLFFQVEAAASARDSLNRLQFALRNYQIGLWLSWIVLVGIAVYYKWTEKNNLFFTGTYGFLVVASSIFGIYSQKMVNLYDLPSRFEDTYTFGIFVTIQNILVSVVLTGFLQAGVWWFTRRWHRR